MMCNEEKCYKISMAYDMMKNLLIQMDDYGDLDSYDVEDIFELIDEIEGNNKKGDVLI